MEILNDLKLEEYNLLKEAGVEFWHANFLDSDSDPIASGFHLDRSIARTIAFAELIERHTVKELRADSKKAVEWGFDRLKNACGFAVGENRENTIKRSIGEAAERWTMSKWIDDKYFIPKIEILPDNLDSVSSWFSNQFDHIDYFQSDCVVKYGERYLSYKIFQTIAYSKGGVFPGSAYSMGDDNWQHALLESFRHLLLVKNNKRLDSFPDNRIHFFSKNGNLAKRQIELAIEPIWPIPVIDFHNYSVVPNFPNWCIARTIFSGWKPWYEGPIDRFVY